MVTVALDLLAEQATPWIEAAAPTHPSLIDSEHRVDAVFGISNVPMAVWIDETGHLVRPAEAATIEVSELRNATIPDNLPDRLKVALTEVKKIPDSAEAYRAAIVDWVANGADSRFVMSPTEVLARSQARPFAHSEAAASFEMGNHLFTANGGDAAAREQAMPYWKNAHALHRENWTYKRQAWTLETTEPGQPSDLSQEVTDSYGTSWLDEVIELGGGENYAIVPEL